jgi:hypothetical protein
MENTERVGEALAVVDCLVEIWDRGQTRQEIIQVETEAIRKQCWRPIAAIKAAALMGLPFQDVLDRAKFGFHREDKARLFGKTQEGA